MKRKVRRFAEGDLIDTMAEDANERTQSAANQGRPAKSESYTAEPDSFVGPKKQRSFKEEFAAQRAKGAKTFTWNGKKYTTELASDKPKKSSSDIEEKTMPKRSGISASTPSSTKTDADEFSAAGTKLTYDNSKATPKAGKEPKGPRERIEPGFWPMKDINPRKPADNSPKRIGSDRPKLTGPQLKLPRGGGGGGGGGGGSRQLMLGSDLDPKALMRERSGPRDDDDSRFADEGNPNYKRGGKVKKMASGGMTKSSASSRGDGCAMRGKTKGKIY